MATADDFALDLRAAVPFALDIDGNRVHPQLCEDRFALYRCPFCEEPVTLVQKTIVRQRQRVRSRPFWRHRWATCVEPRAWWHDWRRRNGGGTGGESELHRTTKRRIKLWFEYELERVKVDRQCAGRCQVSLGRYPLVEFVSVVEEYVLPNGRKLDLALLDSHGKVALAIEIYVSHCVDEEKRAMLDIPWIEVDALEVREFTLRVRGGDEPERYCTSCAGDLEKGRSWWRSFAYSSAVEQYVNRTLPRRLAHVARSEALTMRVIRRLSASLCQAHEDASSWEDRIARARELAQSRGTELPDGVRPQVWYCRSCCQPMLVCHWHGRELGAKPPTEWQSSLAQDHLGGDSEVCPACGTVQTIRWKWLARRGGVAAELPAFSQ